MDAVLEAKSAQRSKWENIWVELKPGEKFDSLVPHPYLVHLVKTGELKSPMRVLIPGCGRGYELVLLRKNGFDVVGIDISETAIREAKAFAEKNGVTDAELRLEDFFDSTNFSETFDLIIDYRFRCALPPCLYESWSKRTCELLSPKGRLLMLLFPLKPYGNEDQAPYQQDLDEIKDFNGRAGLVPTEVIEHLPKDLCHENHHMKSGAAWFKLASKPAD
eukprot:CAMPEP_0198727640 /NCGR_PEP_ID=MMETSP1475-20131203/4615_1 /TAXON_ID= ORGANISM="Unidentified sp., Strain CCMP1999" /NCGR_SAMPLE_ID=MMETSP1475 /ASSEMBLY_ACC=CAM_ASM_001111 /LENGTH=218 /DNA_ID=CAMNT_0044489715 /DNA_START=114 /DNA_END=770 /DNA_ORIENTATION=-